jgi:nucleoside-diphosphate-sugar epimerase
VDAFVPYYPRPVKERNLAGPLGQPNFRLAALDLRGDPPDEAVAGAEAVFHLAAMPGLDRSWVDFEGYAGCNLLATQRLLEAVGRARPPLRRFVHVSTSSVYGRFACGDESMPTRPISPYGVTKLAAENLCRAYADASGLPLVVLRYFSVYGPRQRPDMGYHRFIEAMLDDRPITVNGDGQQSRSNTFVADCVEATVAAVNAPAGEVYNLGGGEAASVWDVLGRLERLAGRPARVVRAPARPGDQRHTFADTARIRSHLGWEARTPLDEGLARQWEWQKRLRAGSPSRR